MKTNRKKKHMMTEDCTHSKIRVRDLWRRDRRDEGTLLRRSEWVHFLRMQSQTSELERGVKG